MIRIIKFIHQLLSLFIKDFILLFFYLLLTVDNATFVN